MSRSLRKPLWALMFILTAGVVWTLVTSITGDRQETHRSDASRVVPVEVAGIERGVIESRRTFSGTLEPKAEFVVAPKVSGRLERLAVDLADPVQRGQVVAWLDNGEYVQAVTQAKADLAVSRAQRSEARSALEIADREYERNVILKKRGVTSASQLDAAQAKQLAAKARLEMAGAQVTKAEALLETARIRLGYTSVAADWTGRDPRRWVAERFVDEGDTVSANTPLLTIMELDPITGVFFVSERDYARLRPGQSAVMVTDAFPGRTFGGRVSRIAPAFKESTRQARVELRIDNPDLRLKPGMFIRATVVLERAEDAVIVPETALTMRGDRSGVFLVNASGTRVVWREVDVGIKDGGRVQVVGQDLSGRVVTLGQLFLDDGSAISIPGLHEEKAGSGEAEEG